MLLLSKILRDLFPPTHIHTNFSQRICYDIEFAEAVRTARKRGCDILFVPTANPFPFEHINDRVVSARCYESDLAIVYCNRVGKEQDVNFCGRSSVCAPGGGLVFLADTIQQGLSKVIGIEAPNSSDPSQGLNGDRRPDLYAT